MIAADETLPILPDPPAILCSHYDGDTSPTWYLVRVQVNKQAGTTVRAFSTHLRTTSPAPTLSEAILAVRAWAPWVRLSLTRTNVYYLVRARHYGQAESGYWLAARTSLRA